MVTAGKSSYDLSADDRVTRSHLRDHRLKCAHKSIDVSDAQDGNTRNLAGEADDTSCWCTNSGTDITGDVNPTVAREPPLRWWRVGPDDRTGQWAQAELSWHQRVLCPSVMGMRRDRLGKALPGRAQFDGKDARTDSHRCEAHSSPPAPANANHGFRSCVIRSSARHLRRFPTCVDRLGRGACERRCRESVLRALVLGFHGGTVSRHDDEVVESAPQVWVPVRCGTRWTLTRPGAKKVSEARLPNGAVPWHQGLGDQTGSSSRDSD